MKSVKITLLILSCISLLGFTQCQSTANTVILPEGPKTTELLKEKDKQITDLKKQVDDEKGQRAAENAEASKAASDVKGIVKAKDYLPDSLPKEAITNEADLALKRLPPDDPAETVKALERVVMIVTGQRDEALKKYQEASGEAVKAKIAIEQKDKELEARKNAIYERDNTITRLEKEKSDEQTAHKNDVQNTINKINQEWQDKERRMWVNTLRIASIVVMVLGVVLIALTSGAAWKQGGLLVAGGSILALIGVGFDIVTSQWWFKYACFGVGAIIIGAIIWGLYHLWQTDKLNKLKDAALQDFKDESKTLGNDAWNKLAEHLDYRMGGNDSYWVKVLKDRLDASNLISKKGEQAAKTTAEEVVKPSN